ncbi:MAG TPA: polysaccharide deacetylase family protein [Stellaceae bacterium]|jgi:peptidoglycan/xylan/chitin deacetylase (PgdA/CDA1 family)|nr:polysaccharide deacetylase family protein [Stellaceae bacterium]
MNGSIASHIARRLGPLMRVRPGSVNGSGGAVSFTFDDFPKSALEAGGAILEKYGARGTYYVALGLAGSDGKLGPIATLDDIRETHERGHELACHTFSHLDCSRAAAGEIADDLRRNQAAFAELLDGYTPTNFAYPYGRYLSPAKRQVAPLYATCRGTAGGVNHGTADFADLRGTRIYAPGFSDAAMRKLIDRNLALGGWLIFYTHDIAETPSEYGCTPAQFESVVAYAAERSPLLPVRDVLTRLEAARAA